MVAAEPRPLTAELVLAASPDSVWRVVSDVRRTGEWSPECRAVTPLRPTGRGTLLLGRNRRGRVGWATVSRVVEFEDGRHLAWRVLTNRSLWSYTVTPVEGGTLLTHRRRTPRGQGRFAAWFTRRLLGGQQAHDDELEAGMAAGLRTIERLAAAGASAAGATGAGAATEREATSGRG